MNRIVSDDAMCCREQKGEGWYRGSTSRVTIKEGFLRK